MTVVNTVDLERSVFGVGTFGVDMFLTSTTASNDGIYYTPIFKKNSYELWDKIKWSDNSSPETFNQFQIEIRTRTGNDLPTKTYSPSRVNYTLDEMNNIVKNQSREYVDSLFYRACLGRSITSDVPIYVHPNSNVPTTDVFSRTNQLGTSLNTFRLWDGKDAVWTYWSKPIIDNPSYIPPNKEFDYIQARITLKTIGTAVTNKMPEVFRINFVSILKDPC